jgi:phage-related protein
MPRNLTAAQKSYAGPIVWLADITTRRGAKHYFAEDAVGFGGNTYQPYLRMVQGPRFTRTLAADFGEIELINADLAVGTLLHPEVSGEDFEGARCELRQLFVGLDAAVLILRGRLTEQEESDAAVRFRVVSELDPAQIPVHLRAYAALCTWRFRRGLCGYLNTGFSFTEHLGERSATAGAIQSITDSTLAMTVDEHKDRYVLLTAGTGRGQLRRIRSNTATTLTVWTPWTTTPDTSTKFKVFSFVAGASKPLWTAAGSAVLQSPNTHSGGGRLLADTSLDMVPDEHKGEILSFGGEIRRIKTNTATFVTIEDDEPDLPFFPPMEEEFFLIRHRRCPKDFVACEARARTEAHNGFPTLVPLVSQAAGGDFPPDFFDGGGGGGGGGGLPL